MSYQDFLESKTVAAPVSGFDIDLSELNPVLKEHQKISVQWACKGGRRALFESFGLGKSSCQLEYCRMVLKHEDGAEPGVRHQALIVCPLGVKQEFTNDAENLLGWDRIPEYVRDMAEIRATDNPILLTNYERVRDGDIDPTYFTACCLDEASVLRSFGSKTYQTFLDKFKGVRYKLVATATPDPNKYKELIHYAGFLEVMDSGQALTRFFQRDSTKANNLTIYPHKEEEFWLWVSTWAFFLSTPSDLGLDAEGYELPPLDIRYHKLPGAKSVVQKDGQIAMFNDVAEGLSAAAREKRESLDARVACMMEIVKSDPEAHFILWHDLEDERRAIGHAMREYAGPGEYAEIYGTQEIEVKEKEVLDFAYGRTKYLATKKEISGQGCNFQRFCHRAIFVGVDYKFNDFIQAIHRIYRFMQTEPVIIDIIYTENEDSILKELMAKWDRHNEQTEKMREIITQYGIYTEMLVKRMQRSIGVERVEVKGKYFTAINNDCVDETKRMETDSVGLIHTSIPFCYDEETEVLTQGGWKKFSEINENTEIGAYDSETHMVVYQKPLHIINEPYKGEMIEFSGRAFNLTVTPNHRMWVTNRGNSEYKIVIADEITSVYENAKRKSNNGERILCGYKLQVVPDVVSGGAKPTRIFIPPLPKEQKRGHGVELYWIETEDFMRLAGWYLSEGHADGFEGRSGGRIGIGQSPVANPKNYAEIKNLLERIGLPPHEGKNQLTVWCRNLAYFLRKEFGTSSENMKIPRWMFTLDGNLLAIMRDTMMKGDGSKDGTSYASISKQLRDDFQELCVLTGWRAILPGGKWVYTGNKEIYPEIRHTPKRYHYEGNIGCVTVPSGLIIVRRKGFTCISGNSNHYEYTPSYNDFGHNEDNERFFEQMDYLTPELLRILKPGRICAVHVKDRILYGNATGDGMPTVDPFSDMTVLHYMKHGFRYMGRIIVLTDVVRENNQTYRLGWSEVCKDGSKMGVGCPEYILLFRKLPTDTSKAYADEPVVKSKEDYTRAQWQLDAHAFWRSSGDRLITKEELMETETGKLQKLYTQYSRDTVYSYEDHVALAKKLDEEDRLPATFMVCAPGSWSDMVWDDIVRMRTLNGEQKRKNVQMHVCLAAGSLILTRDGYKPIEEVELGDMVLTHMGRWKPVIAKARTGIKDTVQTRAKGVPNLITTPDHKLWTRKSEWVRKKEGMRRAVPEWVEAKDTVGHYVNLKLPPIEESLLNEKEWWLVGRYLADGHKGTRGDWFISVGADKCEEFERMALGFYGSHAERDARQYRLLSGSMSDELKAMLDKCGRGAMNKQVPIEGICLNPTLAEALLSGYLSGDGNVTGNCTSASSVSRALLLGMAMVAQRARGVIASVYAGRGERTSTIEGREVHCNPEWVMSWRVSGHHCESEILEDGAWKKVKESIATGEREVWSIQVADDASYMAEGCIVKNCPLQLDIVERIINRYSNEGDVVYDPFGGLMTVPMTAVKMGRYGIGCELNNGYFRDGVGYLKLAEEERDEPEKQITMGIPTLADLTEGDDAEH